MTGWILIMAALAAGPAPLAPEPVVGATAIDAVVEGYRDAVHVPGVAVAVVHGGEVVHVAGYGRTATGEQVTAHTAMPVGSVSKSITAVAVLQLVDAGRVDLDHPVHDYLPEFVMADPRAARITVRQLLDQTSGMSDTTFPAFSRPQPNSFAELLDGLRGAGLAADPGTRWEYHNPNYQVAARLVEAVSGQPFDEYLRVRVFDPLGMVDSRAVDTADDLPPDAGGHLRILGVPVAVPEPPAFGAGSGGVLASAHDMATWLAMQGDRGLGPDGTPIVSAASIDAAHSPSAASGSYAFGWSVGTTPTGAPLIAHGGDLFTATAHQALLPASGYGLAVMANTGLAYGDAAAIADRLVALLERTPPAPPEMPLVAVDAVLIALIAVVLLLGVRGVRHARRWAATRTGHSWTALRLLPLLAPAVLLASIHRVVGLLYRGRDVAWVQTFYLYPTFLLVLLVTGLSGTAVLAARLVALARPVATGAGSGLTS